MVPTKNLAELLKNIHPKLNAGVYLFATLAADQIIDLKDVVALMREPEGVSVIVAEPLAEKLKLTPVFRCVWITLTVASDLQAVGLTAAFSSVLAKANISCNVVAGTHHDHIFVPVDQADAAMQQLMVLQNI